MSFSIKKFLLFFVIAGIIPLLGSAQVLNQTVNVLPAGVDLLWEADAYTPPFYKGKALYPDGGTVRIVAVPDARFGNPKNLFYTWKSGGQVFGSLSGLGRNMFEHAGTILGGEVTVAVEVRETLKGPVVAAGAVRIPTVKSQVLLYEHNPLLGTLFARALQENVPLARDEMTVVAYPYFFSVPERGVLKYVWRVNGNNVENAPAITFRRSEDSGSASVALTVTNPLTILQQTAATLDITF